MSDLRTIAFYLPQFHAIPENDQWWGKGFTEWTNVAKARSLFKEHYQPHIPADLGFYNLKYADIKEEQAKMAKAYGIDGFCYYHYWFDGKLLLETPLEQVLNTQRPDFPFCICWANENWTRTWNGNAKDVLIAQNYTKEDHQKHIQYLLPYFKDPRYIKIEDKPFFVFYNTSDIPYFKAVVQLWREEIRKEGIEMYFCQVQSRAKEKDYKQYNLDGAIDFKPDWKNLPKRRLSSIFTRTLSKLGIRNSKTDNNNIYYYKDMVELYSPKSFNNSQEKIFPCVVPSWDNSARKQKHATIFTGSTPAIFEEWLIAVKDNFKPYSSEENLVFINAWNEWAEGNHLEPDIKWGHQYLEKIKKHFGK